MTDAESDHRARLDRSRPMAPLRVVEASALLGADREVIIVHNGAHYRLRVTQNGKLILTK